MGGDDESRGFRTAQSKHLGVVPMVNIVLVTRLLPELVFTRDAPVGTVGAEHAVVAGDLPGGNSARE